MAGLAGIDRSREGALDGSLEDNREGALEEKLEAVPTGISRSHTISANHSRCVAMPDTPGIHSGEVSLIAFIFGSRPEKVLALARS